MPAKKSAFEGLIFGRLTVVSRVDSPKWRRNTFWLCRCECGNEHVTRHDNLKSGKTTSCGCYRSEARATKNALMWSRYKEEKREPAE